MSRPTSVVLVRWHWIYRDVRLRRWWGRPADDNWRPDDAVDRLAPYNVRVPLLFRLLPPSVRNRPRLAGSRQSGQ
ncbi:Hypothetical protein NTJ_01420 [Nesidiocoris tenuis]|uniref:Chromo domain-containing protein n=1 Tax=Nesidiocoris tenuis TaxID=355587 RepID=A0ABN7A8I4_9HEMI|nr:Hypothetical protein NTJ_01420 [Nesidiocoris tenuis]